MNRTKQDTLLGIVFFGGLATLLWGTAVLTDLSFQARPELQVLFSEAAGLRAGDQTYVLGHRTGTVRSIVYQPGTPAEDRILVTLDLEEPLALSSDMSVTILDANLLGGKRIEIDPGVSETMWPSTQPLRGQVRKNGIEAIGDLVASEDVTSIIAGFRVFVDNLNSPLSTIGRLLTQADLYEDLTATIQSARRSLETLEKAESSLGRLFYSAEMGARLDSAITRADSVIGKIDAGDGPIGRLVNSVEMAENLDQGIASFRSIVQKADTGEGTVAKLLNDGQMASNLDKIIDNLTAYTDEMRNGNGLLNRLAYDEAWGEQLNRIFTQVSRAIEDAREAAPVGTFFQVIAGAF